MQDSWRATRRLTLDCGLRYEYTDPWTEVNNKLSNLLPGVGLRFEFENHDGDRIGVVARRTGEFEIVVYPKYDPDQAQQVFRLTEDIESLHAAAVLRQMERTAHLYIALPDTGTLSTRLGLLVKNRTTVFEAIAPVRRVGERLAANSARIAEGLELHHTVLRTQVAEVFEHELQRLPRPRRVTALDAIDVAAGWETWEQLRRGKGLSVTRAARVMELLIAGALQSK